MNKEYVIATLKAVRVLVASEDIHGALCFIDALINKENTSSE